MAHYALSDLHGNYTLWKKIKNFIGNKDTVYVLGDVIDRGEDGIKILLEMFYDKNDRFRLLKGNHEEMLVDAIEFQKSGFDKHDIEILKNNGTYATLLQYNKLPKEKKEEFYDIIKYSLYDYEFTLCKDKVFFLCHAGISASANIYNEEHINKKAILWDRENTKEKFWSTENWAQDIYIVHGHTPVQYMNYSSDPEIIKYCQGHKINIDLGTPTSGKVALLNLETLEPVYFYENDPINFE